MSHTKYVSSEQQTSRPWLLSLLVMWKIRLPLLVLPVLAGIRRLSGQGFIGNSGSEAWQSLTQTSFFSVLEVATLFTIASATGYFHVPFSVAWWLVLILCYTLETQLLLGVATVISLSVLLGWYGSLIGYPHAICAIWGGTRGLETAGKEALGSVPIGFWQAWDLIVHGIPAILMLWWHGPGISMAGVPYAGTVGLPAVAVALPLTVIWLWAVGLSLGKLWSVRLADTNAAYCVAPALPQKAWLWVHGSHWGVCLLWGACLALPSSCVWLAYTPLLMVMWILFARSNLRKDLLVGRATFFLTVHVLALVGAIKASMHPYACRLWIEAVVMYQIGGFGITCGAHRLWSHRSYVAKLPFRVFLMLLNSFANQGTIFHWARDHRIHHKYTSTPADPHDDTRGFFFAHIGWLLVPKHPDVKAKGEHCPVDDLLADPVVKFQMRAEKKFMFNEIVSFGLPAVYGYFVYGDAWLGFLVHGVLRWVMCLNATWCVNSVAHMFGDDKYDRGASPKENLLTAVLANGEGWHSYHHKYPFDYSTSELGMFRRWNPSKLVIDTAALLGQVRNLKRADHFARRDLGKAQ
jgi:stearoyl-CoA desaturase (delta-9 desaturase)